MCVAIDFKRDLTVADLKRMKVPERYWYVRFDDITGDSGKMSTRQVVKKYLEKIKGMRARGAGLFLWGPNGTGKTSAVVVLAKAYRRIGSAVLFMAAADLKRMVIENEHFDEEETYWDRASKVSVLVIDDLGKGTQDSTGYGASLIDELIRTRNANKLVTFITSNISPKMLTDEEDGLGLKDSTVHTLKECTIAVKVRGEDKRIERKDSLEEMLYSG